MNSYFRYLPPSPHEDVWGCSVTSVGYMQIGSDIHSMPEHPIDHHFVWERGRVLDAFQLVLITDGEGSFESERSGKPIPVRGGNVFVIFPGVWHRYAGVAEIGWTEHWIECRGRAYETALRRGLLDPAHPVIELAETAPLLEVFFRCHECARRDGVGGPEILASLGVHLLCVLVHAASALGGPNQTLERKLEKARRLIVERCDQPLDLPGLAKEVGLGYSHFRQSFARFGGQGVRAFHNQARMRRACYLLANSDLSLKEIADRLGFSSAFHFSSSFKNEHGSAPSQWRDTRRALGLNGAGSG
jgi:AraC-like DNA-binding protein